LPIGVRAVETITASVMPVSSSVLKRRCGQSMRWFCLGDLRKA
jgi:hypothetical protein